MANLLSRYRSISRPRVGTGNSTISSLASKQQSAEDLIIDNQYEDGQMSATAYMAHLRTRVTRPGISPRAVEVLREKMSDVQLNLNDAEVDRMYQAKEVTTDQVLQYEKDKLARMTATDSQAYVKQQQKVQSLTDKNEREKRTAFRVQKTLELSQMPEDTSERILQKQATYAQLAAQARIDGDYQQADLFQAQANNLVASARRAEINDYINEARLSVSQTPTRGLTTPPNVASGTTAVAEMNGEGGGADTTYPSAVSTGFSAPTGGATSSAMKALDRAQKSLDRMYGQREDKQVMIAAYQQAVQAAEGDQKTQLTIALNNLTDDLSVLDSSIENQITNIEGAITRIQEAQVAAAKKNFRQEVSKNNLEFNKAENDLETEFAKGKISKEEYVQKGALLAETKTMFFSQASDIFNEYDDVSSAESYLQKASQMEEIHQNLINVGTNLDDYEPLVVDPSGRVTNLLGKSVQPGQVTLQNVRQLKDAGVFDSNYVQMDGKYFRVHFPGETSDATGLPYAAITAEELGRIKDTAFIYKAGEDGKLSQEKVGFLDVGEGGKSQLKAVPRKVIDVGLETKRVVETATGFKMQQIPIERTTGQKVAGAAAKFEKVVAPALKTASEFIQSQTTKPNAQPTKNPSVQDIFRQGLQTINPFNLNPAEARNQFNQSVTTGLGNVVKGAGNFVTGAVDKIRQFFNPKEVAAADIPPTSTTTSGEKYKFVSGTPEQYKALIIQASKESGIPTDVLSGLLKQESNFNPNAKSPVGATGIAQFMPATARAEGVNPLDPKSAIPGAARYLKKQLDQFDGDMSKALAAYNAGAGNVRKYGGVPPFEETQKYVSNILNSVGNAVTHIFSGGKSTVSIQDRDTEMKNRNIELALGLKPGEYVKGVKPSAEQIAKAYRSDDATRKLLADAGIKPVEAQQTFVNPTQKLGFARPSAEVPKLVQDAPTAPGKISARGLAEFKQTPAYKPPNIIARSTPAPYKAPTIKLPIINAPAIQKPINNVVSTIQRIAQPVVSKVQDIFKSIFRR